MRRLSQAAPAAPPVAAPVGEAADASSRRAAARRAAAAVRQEPEWLQVQVGSDVHKFHWFWLCKQTPSPSSVPPPAHCRVFSLFLLFPPRRPQLLVVAPPQDQGAHDRRV